MNHEELTAANINPVTYLATDYLNHFNEVLMLMEMVPDMPDMIEEVMAWEPYSYEKHFSMSVFAAKDLAIAAYECAPSDTRAAFDSVVADLDQQIVDLQILLSGVDVTQPMDPAVADHLMMTIVNDLRPAIDRASGIVNGTSIVEPDANAAASMRAQDAIDELFA